MLMRQLHTIHNIQRALAGTGEGGGGDIFPDIQFHLFVSPNRVVPANLLLFFSPLNHVIVAEFVAFS